MKKIGEIGVKINWQEKKKKSRNIHSRDHLLADEISVYFHEPKKFAMYLGVIGRIGFRRACQIFSEIKQSKVKSPAKLFMWKVGQLKNPGAKIRHKPRTEKKEKETDAVAKFKQDLYADELH